MKLAVVVIGDGRSKYLSEVVASMKHILHPVTARIMINDEADPNYCANLNILYPDFSITHTGRVGMAGAVQAGFAAALATDPDYTLWLEEDMVLTNPPPLTAAIHAMEANPTLAQMCFRREAWDPSEGDDQLSAIAAQASFVTVTDSYTIHDFIFSLNPSIIPSRVMRMGWPSGPLGIGNETGMTYKLLAAGYTFGSWGQPGDGQSWARHIGNERAAGWRL